jgi:ABC-2 type transport system ATP-binding protein
MYEVLRLEHVSKRYHLRESRTIKEFLPAFLRQNAYAAQFYALRDVSFSLQRGEGLGIIGPNGSGKSTTLKLIAGVTAPTSGRVLVSGRVAPLIELGAGFHPDLTGRENVFLNGCILGLTNKQVQAALEDIVEFAQLERFIEMPVKRYSSGMFVRLAFSIAIHSQPEILIVDEALAVGDMAFQEKCLERVRQLRREGVTLVFVTHGLDMIREFCNRAILLESGSVVMDGEPAEVIDAYTAQVQTGTLV